MLLGTLSARLLGNLLTGKGVKAKTPEKGVMRTGEEQLELIKLVLEQAKIFNVVLLFNEF